MGKDEETKELIKMYVTSIIQLQRNRNLYLRFGIEISKTNELKMRSEVTSLFDVQRWTFDVRRSAIETSP